jgi:hypothetical protein
MSEIVKVQIPLASTDPNVKPMIYDRHRKHMTFQVLDTMTKKSLGSDVKGYFDAEWSSRKEQWQLGRRTKDRDW